jgi:hypothetical protein
MANTEIQRVVENLLPYIMLAFICSHGGGLADLSTDEVHDFSAALQRDVVSKQILIRDEGQIIRVMASRLGRTERGPVDSCSLFLPSLGWKGGGQSSSVTEYSMEAGGLASGGYAMGVSCAFQLVTAYLSQSGQMVCIRWRSLLYCHGMDMVVHVSYFMFRALMTLPYWSKVRSARSAVTRQSLHLTV